MQVRLRCVAIPILGLALSAARGLPVRAEESPPLHLSDPKGRELLTDRQAWGELGFDSAVRPEGQSGAPLRIGDRSYPRGLGHHASGEIDVDLDGRFLSFDAEIGVQWQGGNTTGSVEFQVFVDGRKAFDSGIVRESDPPRVVSIPTKGASELRLVVLDAGDGIACDCANWAMARLSPDPRAEAERIEVNVAAFGRVMTWDPSRREGTKASRTGEFPAEDIELGRRLDTDRNGAAAAPDQGGAASLGIQWSESRGLRRLELEFDDPATAPADGSVVAETWSGESAWQGRWEPLDGGPVRKGSKLVWETAGQIWRKSTPKIRWVFPSGGRAIGVKSIGAFTRSRWRAEEVRIEPEPGTKPEPRAVPVEIYNGVATTPPGSDPHRFEWRADGPLDVRLLSSIPRADKTDRTVFRFGTDADGFAIAVEDVLARGFVSFRGIRVTAVNRPEGFDSRTPAVTPGVLEETRRRPDETLAHAMEVVHRDVQDLGPTMLSLACDNRKLVADREGDVRFDSSIGINDAPKDIPTQWRLRVRAGTGKATETSRRLLGGWLPIPETTTREGSIVYRQSTQVAPVDEAKPDRPAWVRDQALGVVEFAIRNEGNDPAPASLTIAAEATENATIETTTAANGGSTVIASGDRVLAIADGSAAGPLSVRRDPTGPTLTGTLAPGAEARLVVLVPLWRVAPGETIPSPVGATWAERTEAYWKAILAPGMRLELPEPFLVDLILASRVHCLMAARSEDSGRRVAAWISSDRYGPLESEAHAVIRGMDMFGHDDYARRSLEFFIHRYDPAGFLTTGYTLVGTGEHLWTLAEHVERTNGDEWLRRVAPETKRVADWIVRQRAKTKLAGPDGRPLPGYGLMPPGVSADWGRFAYRFFNDAQYHAGLAGMARVLKRIGDPDADPLEAEATAYRADIAAAYRWSRARSPVLPLGNDRWTMAQPSLLDAFGLVEEFQPGEDWNRSWAYGVELGSHHLATTGVLDPGSAEVGEMLDYLEGAPFLRSGMGEYPEEASREDPFGLGGFSKVQPYYARVAEIYAERDDVRPFLRTYLHSLASLVSRENMSLWEHFHNQGGWNKTHETGWFLCQTRLMLVRERGDDLWLAPMMTDRWLEDGKTVAVRDVPTRFGKVGYSIRSHVAEGWIEATIDSPTGPIAPGRIVLRLRHPEGRPIRSATASNGGDVAIDATSQTVALPATREAVTIRVEY